MYINKALVYGNLTRDPELRALPSGIQVANFSVATNRVWKKDGQKQESTDYHNIVSFGRQAELIAQYLKKGSSVFIEGRMQTRSWDDKASGEKKYRTEIVAENVQFGPRTSGGGGGGKPAEQREAAQAAPKEDAIDYPEEEINPDDIPF